ncbi:hypothetical protein GCM10027436_34540 [Actinophytocola sediminis]
MADTAVMPTAVAAAAATSHSSTPVVTRPRRTPPSMPAAMVNAALTPAYGRPGQPRFRRLVP